MARKKAFGKDSAVQKSKVLRRGLDAHCSFRRISDDQESHGTHGRKGLCGSGLSIRQTRCFGELMRLLTPLVPSSPNPIPIPNPAAEPTSPACSQRNARSSDAVLAVCPDKNCTAHRTHIADHPYDINGLRSSARMPGSPATLTMGSAAPISADLTINRPFVGESQKPGGRNWDLGLSRSCSHSAARTYPVSAATERRMFAYALADTSMRWEKNRGRHKKTSSKPPG